MPASPPPQNLRPAIRDAMKAAPDRKWTLAMLHSAVVRQFPGAKIDAVAAALRWNFERGFADYHHDPEMEVDFYFPTQRGLDS